MSRIRDLRMKKGLSISKLSQVAGVNASVVSWAELGKLAASPAVRTTLSNFYGEAEEELFLKNGMAI